MTSKQGEKQVIYSRGLADLILTGTGNNNIVYGVRVIPDHELLAIALYMYAKGFSEHRRVHIITMELVHLSCLETTNN